MLFKRGETIVYGSTHTTAASLNGSIWISIETVSSRRAARWRHSRITIQFSVVWSSTFGPGCIPGPFETYEKHHHNQNEDNLKNNKKIFVEIEPFLKIEKIKHFMDGFGLTMNMALIMMTTKLGTDSSLLPWPMVPVTSSVIGLEMVLL